MQEILKDFIVKEITTEEFWTAKNKPRDTPISASLKIVTSTLQSIDIGSAISIEHKCGFQKGYRASCSIQSTASKMKDKGYLFSTTHSTPTTILVLRQK